MAYSRIIRQNFFNHPTVAGKFKLEERFFLIGLACTADDYGKFWYSPANIRSNIFPTDHDITVEWIEQCLKKFENESILCTYEVDGMLLGHFPKWFDVGWFLKQKIDHPREYQHPDSPECMTETLKRETSRTIKRKKSKPKKSKDRESNIGSLLSLEEYQKLYPNKDIESSYKKLLNSPNASHTMAIKWFNGEIKMKSPIFRKSHDGKNYIAYCSKCGNKEFPNNDFQIKSGSSCCHVEYVPDNPQIKPMPKSNSSLSNSSMDLQDLIKNMKINE